MEQFLKMVQEYFGLTPPKNGFQLIEEALSGFQKAQDGLKAAKEDLSNAIATANAEMERERARLAALEEATASENATRHEAIQKATRASDKIAEILGE